MGNKRLKREILEILDNQIKINEPKCTKFTLERLISLGYTEEEAKEMTGSVLIEHIYYYMLNNNKKFDEKSIVKN